MTDDEQDVQAVHGVQGAHEDEAPAANGKRRREPLVLRDFPVPPFRTPSWLRARAGADRKGRKGKREPESAAAVPPGADDPSGCGEGRRHLRRPGPPNGFTMMPWLLLGLGSFSNIVQGKTPDPWIGVLGLLVFNSLYVSVVFRSFVPGKRDSPQVRWMVLVMGLMTFALAGFYGGSWLLFLPLFGLACGTVLRGRWLGWGALLLGCATAAIAAYHEGWTAVPIAYGSAISMMVTAAILTLSETVMQLRATRQELARSAVEQERLRFSRDLHDLLGHTLSVIVVKAEAARRLAPVRLDAALTQVADIESVGRQALTEVREAVTGYREGSLAADLDRARSALDAAGVETVVRQSGPPLDPATEALLGWVVREAVTNVVRHSGAGRCEIEVQSTDRRVRASVSDDGVGVHADLVASSTGTGLKGLRERIAAAGGALETDGSAPGFRVTATLPSGDGVRTRRRA
ncbi:sensor histidine kinase [Streptomyces sp. NRRL F-5126]|uniref:sensor histidine kinase n=1 Tax=Streptomyces sp. NRRL F-5126 TaxID=1463857 RepID=UPI000B2BAB0E|nr:sensor histidine kinase [Streptomyces sp. NRRL F-5126]